VGNLLGVTRGGGVTQVDVYGVALLKNVCSPPIPDIPYRGSRHLPQLALAVANRAIQRPVVEMLGPDAGRPVAHGAADLEVAGSLGLLPADEMRRIVKRGAWEQTDRVQDRLGPLDPAETLDKSRGDRLPDRALFAG